MQHQNDHASTATSRASWRFRVMEVRFGTLEALLWLLLWMYCGDLAEQALYALRGLTGGAFDADAVIGAAWWPRLRLGLRLLVTVALLVYVARVRRLGLRYFGLGAPRWKDDALFTATWALLTGSVFAAILVGLGIAAGERPEWFLNGSPEDLARLSPPKVLWQAGIGVKDFGFFSLLSLVLIAPLIEEIWFRGWLYPVLRKQFNAGLAITFSALLFAFAHGNYPVSQLIGGFVFGYAYERRGSLWVPITLHILGNGSLALLSWFVKEGVI